MPRFVIMDRDGTLIVERNYLSSPADVELLPRAADGLRAMAEMGWKRLVITNQSGVGRGYFTLETVDAVNLRMQELLAQAGASIDGIYTCPHAPSDHCGCRKPQPGLLLQAAREWVFDPSQCVVIGDKACDIDFGRRVGATTILVRTGYGAEELARGTVTPDYVANDLVEASALLKAIETTQAAKFSSESRAL